MNDEIIKNKTKYIQQGKLVSALEISYFARRAHKTQQTLILATVTIADINRTLEKLSKTQTNITLESIKKVLPERLYGFESMFLDDKTNELPPHRHNHDMEINLEKDEKGIEKLLPYGPLHEMSREELLIRASSSPASSPVLFARKPGGGLVFCVDYRGINAITKKDRYPLPLICETLRQLTKSRWFTKVDVRAAFHRLRIKEGDEWKTAFRTRQGLYEWLVCPFGLCGAPATFQRFINSTLREYLDIFCSAYIDDVIIYSEGDLDDHFSKVRKVRKVLNALNIVGLRLDLDKCCFGVKEVKYLRFIIEAGTGVKFDPNKVQAITEWEQPSTVSAVRSFLGFSNFYHEFIPNFSAICEPLNSLTKKGVAWKWETEQYNAFNKLK
ncbi:hypothetical protein K3495_g11722 [Podosphaera aphanis]|nr:hypothetical protein K3495_g11722 [Podosphaera aphanis]